LEREKQQRDPHHAHPHLDVIGGLHERKG
jgi:hypothetical protein